MNNKDMFSSLLKAVKSLNKMIASITLEDTCKWTIMSKNAKALLDGTITMSDLYPDIYREVDRIKQIRNRN